MRHQISSKRSVLSKAQLETLLNAAIFGILGDDWAMYFYNPGLYLADPAIPGLGRYVISWRYARVMAAIYIPLIAIARRPWLAIAVAVIAPIGLFLGGWPISLMVSCNRIRPSLWHYLSARRA